MQEIKECPICTQNLFDHFLTCKDHTVSHETFDLIRCKACDFVITSPRPGNHELARYYFSENYISHTKTSTGLVNIIYNIAKQFTLKWKVSIIKNNAPATKSILDFGCGTGDFLYTCYKAGFTIHGIEPSDTARKNIIESIQSKVTKDLKQTDELFDVITLWHVLEHVPDLNEQITALKNRLSKNGTMFIAVPNPQSKDAQLYKNQWAGYDVPRHLWHFTDTNMRQLMNKHGLSVKKIIPMKLDAFYVSMLSEKYLSARSGFAPIINGFISGLRSNLVGRKNNQYSSLIYLVQQ